VCVSAAHNEITAGLTIWYLIAMALASSSDRPTDATWFSGGRKEHSRARHVSVIYGVASTAQHSTAHVLNQQQHTFHTA
jgi:hypothetical protein